MVSVTVIHGDMLTELPKLAASSLDACVCDPPYHLTTGKRGGSGDASVNPNSPAGRSMISTGFMGKQWDGGDVAFRITTWNEVFAVLKPGAYLLAFGGTRTFHRMACAIEDAGFEIRDVLCWLYGSGFPKSLDVSKAIDATLLHGNSHSRSLKLANESRPGESRTGATLPNNGVMSDDRRANVVRDTPATPEAAQWQGWGTALKPAYEPIIMARKPLAERTVAANVLRHGTGAINVDACRVEGTPEPTRYDPAIHNHDGYRMNMTGADTAARAPGLGRFPANVVHDGSDEVEAAFAQFGERVVGKGSVKRSSAAEANGNQGSAYGKESRPAGMRMAEHHDTGTASRFFYTAKADAADRLQSKHPTVKPVDLMRWLVRMVTPPGGTVLDPFAGSGTTATAAMAEGFNAVLIEREEEYYKDILRRINHVDGADTPLFAADGA